MKPKPKNKMDDLKKKYAKKSPVKPKGGKKSVKKNPIKKVSRETSKKPPKKRNYKLTPKILMFCKEYIIDLNGKQSAIRAGYSEKTAEQQASRLLRNVKVKIEIQKLMGKREKRTEITADYVLGNIKEIGERCMQRSRVMVRDGKKMVPKKEWVEDENGEEQLCDVWEFKEMGALKSQELLGKNLKIFTEKVEEKVVERTKYITIEEEAEIKKHIRKSIQ